MSSEISVSWRRKDQREKERSRLLEEQMRETSSLSAALVKAQEDLDKEQLQWRQEKSGLLESLSVLKQALRDREQDRETSTNDLMSRVVEMENLMEEVQRQPQRRSLRKRFLNFFRRQ
ncbi:titin-like protein [Lates japonicus]|uniref:Titin-like protein n=1 Tax=Lates japonicus TaxID=270547 RepID=A0AAD3MJ30_LATJO|nr:titin-like protein [Lates japonicus]